MGADSDARKVIENLPELSEVERQYLQSVSRGEGFYGLGWGNPSKLTKDLSAKFGIDPRAGVGSNNWGAEQGQGSAGSFPHVDTRSDGTPYVEQYKRHKTPEEGAASVARILLKTNLRDALRTGFYPGPVMRFKKPTKAQQSQFDYKNQFKGQILSPLQAAVFTQSDNGYYELHPEQYLKAVTNNYNKLVMSLGWEPLLLRPPAPLAPSPEVPTTSGQSQSSEQSATTPLPEAGFLRNQTYSVPGIQDEPKK